MKNFIKSKRFLISVLAIACVGILVTCFLVSRDQKSDFHPEELSTNTDTQEMPAIPSPAGNRTNTSSPAPAATKDPMEEYPKVVDESETEVVIDFTPEGEDLKTETPEPPTAEGDTTDPSAPPTYAPEETEPAQTAPPAQDTNPAPGSVREDGAVYDPVFGWVVPGQVNQAPADSSGDPGKMVGDM